MFVIRGVRLSALLFVLWAMTGQAQAQMVVVPTYGGWGGGWGGWGGGGMGAWGGATPGSGTVGYGGFGGYGNMYRGYSSYSTGGYYGQRALGSAGYSYTPLVVPGWYASGTGATSGYTAAPRMRDAVTPAVGVAASSPLLYIGTGEASPSEVAPQPRTRTIRPAVQECAPGFYR